MTHSKFFSTPLLLSVLILSACASGGTGQTTSANSMNPALRSTAIDKAMEKALTQAEASGNKQEILALLGQVHNRNPNDSAVATRYAIALREDEQINAAIRTLTPHTKGEKENVAAVTEMAMTQLSLGDFEAAESYATRATEMDPKNARAYLALGTAQDAQSRHQDAEVSFRKGVKHWKGDPSPILNNLALNLASQGHLEESLALIHKAQKISPGRLELERNRRIISTLLETTGPRPPAPGGKPKTEDVKLPEEKPQPKAEAKTSKPPKPMKKNIAQDNIDQVEQETIQEVEKKIEDAIPEEKIEVKAEGTTKLKTNIKLKPLNQQ